MKKTKNNRNQLIAKLVLNVAFLIGYFFYSIQYLSSFYKELEDNKDQLITNVDLHNTLLNEGLTYTDFKKQLSSVPDKNDYSFKIVSKIDKSFYDSNIKNETEEPFSQYFVKKENEIIEKESSPEILARSQTIDSILPYYVDGIDLGENNITDFQFINFVESLLETFSLKTTDPIGIDRVLKVDDGNTDTQNTLDSSLFYIPLSFSLEGGKKNILDFLYYIEHVGNIEVSNNNLKIYEDKNFGVKRLTGEKYSRESNIFEKQLIEIESVKFDKYLDSSIKNRGETSFLDFIKDSQSREKIGMEITLNFYVRGISNLRIEKKINEVADQYTTLRGIIKKNHDKLSSDRDFQRKGSAAIQIINSYRNYFKYMESKSEFFIKEMKLLKKDKDAIYGLYKEMLSYEDKFKSMEESIKLMDEKINEINAY